MTAVIIQARMSSTRLPGKSMLHLAGKPLLWHVVERCRRSKKADTVIVATSRNEEDAMLEELCRGESIACYRGALQNVLERYYEAAKEHNAGTIVRITADCPLIDPGVIDDCVCVFEESGADYISNVHPKRTFPRGLDVEVFSFRALEKAYREAETAYEKEHVTPYIWENKNGEFTIGPAVLSDQVPAGDFRLVIDYPEDYELFKKIYGVFYEEGDIISVPEVVGFLRRHPEMAAINADGEQTLSNR